MFNFIVKNARKPKSFFGRIFIKRMNKGHRPLHNWAINFINKNNVSNILDVGCGGGILIEALLKKFNNTKICGIDYSALSVEKTSKLNKQAIKENKCEVLQADVTDIPYNNNSFDITTAFETIYFWPDIKKGFSEIYRTLKQDGMFVVCNEASCYEDTKKYAQILKMNVYTPEEIENFMKQTGFSKTKIYKHENNIWIVVVGYKN